MVYGRRTRKFGRRIKRARRMRTKRVYRRRFTVAGRFSRRKRLGAKTIRGHRYPPVRNVTVRWTHSQAVAAGAAGATTLLQSLRSNCGYAPWAPGSGGSPNHWVDLHGPYMSNRVVRSRLRVRVFAAEATAKSYCLLVKRDLNSVYAPMTSPPGTRWNDVIADDGVTYKLGTLDDGRFLMAENNFDLWRDLGPTVNIQNTWGAAGLDPIQIAYYHVALAPADATSATPAVTVTYEMELDVQMRSLKMII